jgi:arylformamidase
LIDISRSISPATAVWPGDQEVEWSWTTRLGHDGASVNLGSLRLSTHVGSHADAPFHVDADGRTLDQLPLSAFAGPVEVIEVEDASIRPDHVSNVGAERVLVKTEASQLPDTKWPDSVVSAQPDAIRRLEEEDVVLFGTDAPSVDPLNSTSLPAHHALLEAGIVNLEGLCLEGVQPGLYTLTAFPLKIPNADAAPVRAVLHDETPVDRLQ